MDYGVSGLNLDSIHVLFGANHLSTTNLQFQSWSAFTTSGTMYSGLEEQVSATQFFNGLPVFQEDKYFIFYAGQYQPGEMYGGFTGFAPGTDTSGKLALSDVRGAFLDHVFQSVRVGGALNTRSFTPSKSSFSDSCLTATLGYIDAGLIPGNGTPLETILIKVWKVTPLSGVYPLVYVEDDNGFAWGVPFIIP